MKINFNINLTGITTFLLVLLSFILIILKAVNLSTFSWIEVSAPFILAWIINLLPSFVVYIYDRFFS